MKSLGYLGNRKANKYLGFEQALIQISLEEIALKGRAFYPHVFYSTPDMCGIYGSSGLGKSRLMTEMLVKLYPNSPIVKNKDELISLINSKELKPGTVIIVKED